MIYHSTTRDGSNHLDDLETTVRRTTKLLRPHLAKFDSIVVTGLSGIVVGVPVAMRLKKPLVILRKDGEPSHGQRIVNVKNLGERALWLDDFVSMGSTRSRVMERLETTDATMVGEALYAPWLSGKGHQPHAPEVTFYPQSSPRR